MKGIVFGKGFLGTRIAEEFGFQLCGINPAKEKKRIEDSLDYGWFEHDEMPDLIINAIGKTGRPNVDWCEDHKIETMESNVVAAINLGLICEARGIYFVHLGSGCVYSDDMYRSGFNFYKEEDPPNFYEQYYARTKIMAENALKEFPCLQVRLRMPIDDRPHPRNLIDKLLAYEHVLNIKNSMTVVPDMLYALGELIKRKKTGIYNIVNPGTISPFEVCLEYRRLVDPKHSAYSITLLDTKAPRANCALSIAKPEKENIFLPDILYSVRRCLLKWKEVTRNEI